MAADPSDEALDRLLRDDGRGAWRDWVDRLGPPGRRWMAAVALAGLVVAGAGWWWLGSPSPPPELSLPVASTSSTSRADPTSTLPAAVVVHVAGAVVRPGLVELPGGSRWADAVAAAGGPGPGGDLDRVNLALPVADGERIYVPRVGELSPPVVAGGVGAPPGDEDGDPAPVDVNTADSATLETLPGIGEATAGAIIEHRERHGPFRGADDLLDVRGIGPAKLEALRDLVRFGR